MSNLECSEPGGCQARPLNSTSKYYCYSARIPSTVLQGLPFGGIPTVLSLTFVFFLVLLVLFSFSRKYDFWRLGWVIEADSVEPFTTSETSVTSEGCERPSSVELDHGDKGFWSWLKTIYDLKDAEIREKCGEDAMAYFCLQRHMIWLFVALTVLAVGVILPVNYSGSLHGNTVNSFSRTTVANLDADNRLLWLHTIVAVLFLFLTLYFMRRHTSKVRYKEDDLVKRTLLIYGLPKHTQEIHIKEHFKEAYENCTVLEACICYNVARLMNLDAKRRKAESHKKVFMDLMTRGYNPTMIYTNIFGHLCGCIEWFEKEDAVSYYTKQVAKLGDAYRKERARVSRKPLGIAFVTFQDESITSTILKDFNALRRQGFQCKKPESSKFSADLQTQNWTVSYAPDPQNVYWEHLSVAGYAWWSRFLIINLALFCLLFFFTTPAIMMSTMDKFNVTKPVQSLNNPIITQFFPSVLLWSCSAFLTFIVYNTANLESHWTRSGENRATMSRCYIYLIFMVLILPSLGLGSLDVFFRWLFDKSFLEEASVRFECVFLPDSGVFFVNYVIFCALIGNVMDLLRLPSLFLYMISLVLGRSSAERWNVKKQNAFEFPFGASYAWTTCVFAVVVTYSITCPIIVPFGLMYILIKHLVDRYNMYYAYMQSKLGKSIHSVAVNQVMAAPILCLVWIFFFSVVRAGFSAGTSVFTFIVLVITIIIGISHICFGHFKYLSAHNYKDVIQDVDELEKEDQESTTAATQAPQRYIAQILKDPNLDEDRLDQLSQEDAVRVLDENRPVIADQEFPEEVLIAETADEHDLVGSEPSQDKLSEDTENGLVMTDPESLSDEVTNYLVMAEESYDQVTFINRSVSLPDLNQAHARRSAILERYIQQHNLDISQSI